MDKIKEILGEIKEQVGDSSEAKKWFREVQIKAAKFETDEEELKYLQRILEQLQNPDEDNAETDEKPHANIWPAVVIGLLLAVILIVGSVWYFLTPKNGNADAKPAEQTISKVISLPKEEFKIMDYVYADGIKANPDMKNTQGKVFVNGSTANSLSSDANTAVNEMIDYMSHNASALKEKAMTFNIVDQNFDEKKWLEEKDGKLYYNKEGQDVFYQVKAFLSRSKVTSKVMDEGSNYYATGLTKDNKVVVSQNIQNLSGQQYIEVRNPEGSTEKYCYNILAYCGNTVMKTNNIPGVPKGKVEIPTPKKPEKPTPSKPNEPSKPSEPSKEKPVPKKPELDPANQGKAPIGGGKKDDSDNGSETPKASLPEEYVAPSQSSQSQQTAPTPSQDSRVSEPSQWSGAGTVTDSNGTTKVEQNGSVTTPDGRSYGSLTTPSSVPPVESGANGPREVETSASSSANFANSSMSEPEIDD